MNEETDYLLRFATAEQIALCTPCRVTFWRWKSGRQRVPLAVVNLLRWLVSGVLPSADWDGWRFHQGKLYDPSGRWHTPATIEAWYWTSQRLQDLRATENTIAAAFQPAHAITDELYRRLEKANDDGR